LVEAIKLFGDCLFPNLWEFLGDQFSVTGNMDYPKPLLADYLLITFYIFIDVDQGTIIFTLSEFV
jgi:hypothetical protein